jgi:gluconokinase
MGVSGCGKSTVAARAAAALGWPFAEGDDAHPPANVAAMRSGRALTDDDRWPWLNDLAAWIAGHDAAGRSSVLACSALRRPYRDVLRSGAGRVLFVHLDGPPEVIRSRLAERRGHFMPASLLASQLAAIEPLAPDENGLVLDLRHPPGELVEQLVAHVSQDKS